MRFVATCALLCAALVAKPAAAELDMTEGLWETTLTADGRTRSLGTSCYTKADIAEMERMLQGRSNRADNACRYSDFVQSGSSVRYTMICRNGDGEQRSEVVADYRGDWATGTVRSGAVSITTSSKRVGSCPQSSFTR
jgi:hypothetical protein